MTTTAATLGILACLSMAGATHGSAMPDPAGGICYGGREMPKEPPQAPKSCHAVVSWTEHRKVRTFP